MKGHFASFAIAALSVCWFALGNQTSICLGQVAPAAGKPDVTQTPAPDAAAARAAAAEFTAKLEEWKGLLKELRSLKLKFDTAQDADVPTIQKEWTATVARGQSLLPQLREVGIKAYAASPSEDRELERFLVKMLHDDVDRDHHDQAVALGKLLLDSGCDDRQVLDLTGVAAFCIADFERADAYLKKAREGGVLSAKGNEYLALIPEYKGFWAKEQEIRQKESEQNDLPRVKVTTSKGDVVIELFENEAPETVGNFISLVEKGFYNGLVFHRVLKNFMAQGGCPQGTGRGGPGYSIYCECYNEIHRKHFRGTLSMAKAGRDTGGSQFFLTFTPTAHLNGVHTAFGRVIEGLEVLSELTRIDPDAKERQPEPDKMVKVEVLRKRDHEYKPNKVQ